MRPRRLRRGMRGHWRGRHVSGWRPRFNEAPATSPGNGVGVALNGDRRLASWTGFNEAPATSPGNGLPAMLFDVAREYSRLQ